MTILLFLGLFQRVTRFPHRSAEISDFTQLITRRTPNYFCNTIFIGNFFAIRLYIALSMTPVKKPTVAYINTKISEESKLSRRDSVLMARSPVKTPIITKKIEKNTPHLKIDILFNSYSIKPIFLHLPLSLCHLEGVSGVKLVCTLKYDVLYTFIS